MFFGIQIKTAGLAPILLILLQLVLWVLQLAAIISGVQALFDIHWIWACILFLFVFAVPLLPTVMGFFGAIEGWGWAWWQAGLLFFGLQIAVFLMASLLGLATFSLVRQIRKQRRQQRTDSMTIEGEYTRED